MKTILATIVTAALLTAFTFSVKAEDTTIRGDALCTKCELHETAKCGTAIRTADGTIYYADNNHVAKDFHKNICQAPGKVVATGEVGEKDGKKTIKLSKIEMQ